MKQMELFDALQGAIHNNGEEGVSDELLHVVRMLTPRERGKLAAVLGRFGYHVITAQVQSNSEIKIYEAQNREDARAHQEGREPRLIARLEDIQPGE